MADRVTRSFSRRIVSPARAGRMFHFGELADCTFATLKEALVALTAEGVPDDAEMSIVVHRSSEHFSNYSLAVSFRWDSQEGT